MTLHSTLPVAAKLQPLVDQARPGSRIRDLSATHEKTFPKREPIDLYNVELLVSDRRRSTTLAVHHAPRERRTKALVRLAKAAERLARSDPDAIALFGEDVFRAMRWLHGRIVNSGHARIPTPRPLAYWPDWNALAQQAAPGVTLHALCAGGQATTGAFALAGEALAVLHAAVPSAGTIGRVHSPRHELDVAAHWARLAAAHVVPGSPVLLLMQRVKRVRRFRLSKVRLSAAASKPIADQRFPFVARGIPDGVYRDMPVDLVATRDVAKRSNASGV